MATTAKLEVALEMGECLYSASASSGAQTPIKYQMQFNASDFDGNPVFYFEIDASGNADSVSRDVILRDVTNSADRATISIPGTTGAARCRLRSSSFTPASGEVVYSVTIPQTTADNDIYVRGARVIVVQDSTATKTVIDIPMLTADYGNVAENGGWISDSVSYNQGSRSHQFYRFLKTASNWSSSGITCGLDAVFGVWNGGDTGTLGLVDVDNSNTEVTGMTVTSTATDPNMAHAHTSSYVAWSNLTDGHNFEIMGKTTASNDSCILGRCSLRLKMTNLTKGEIHRFLAHDVNAVTGSAHYDQNRAQYTAANISSPTVYYEATGLCSDNANAASLYEVSSDAAYNEGSLVTGASINFNSATKARQRTSAITPTTTYNVYPYGESTTNAKSFFAHLVIAFAGETGWTGLTVYHAAS